MAAKIEIPKVYIFAIMSPQRISLGKARIWFAVVVNG